MISIDFYLLKFEQLKKQKSKASKTGNTKKKEDTKEPKEEANPQSREDDTVDNNEEPLNVERPRESIDAPSEKQDEISDKASPEGTLDVTPKPHSRQHSMSVQSKMRSSSFRRTSLSQGPLSPSVNGPKSPELPILSPEGDSVNSIYRKQAARLDDLERENKRLTKEAQETERKWKKTEEELEELREASGEVAELKSRAQKLEDQTDELKKMVSSLP